MCLVLLAHCIQQTRRSRQYAADDCVQILVAAPQELIKLACEAMLHPGDHVVCVYPAYQALYELASHRGCQVSLWEPDLQTDGSYVFDVSPSRCCVSAASRVQARPADKEDSGCRWTSWPSW